MINVTHPARMRMMFPHRDPRIQVGLIGAALLAVVGVVVYLVRWIGG